MDLYNSTKKRKKKIQEPDKIYTHRENMITGAIIAILGGGAVAWFSYDSYTMGKSTISALIFMGIVALVLVVLGLYKLIYTLTSPRYSKEASDEERKLIEAEMKKRK